jgi:proteasome lid subunit RPN8/RPN11
MILSAVFGEWRHPRFPFTIDYSTAAIEEIRRHVLEAFYSIPRGGAEAGGVLFGKRIGQRIRIVSAVPVRCEHASGPTFTLSSRDEAGLAALLRAGPPDNIPGLQAVGWYHSHTRSDLCLSKRDLDLWHRFFPEPWQVALVLRPSHMNAMRAAFFFRESDGTVRAEAPYSEVELLTEPAPLPEPEPVTLPPRALPETAPAPPPPLPLATPPPRFTPAQPPRRNTWAWAATVVTLVAAGVYAGREPLTSLQDFWRQPVHLQVQREGDRLLVRWNPDAAAIERATAGTLHLEDGAATTAIVLNRAQLNGGHAPYQPHSPHVQVRLILRQPDGQTVVETAAEHQ